MKVYAPDGSVYEGDSVDCRELMKLHGYTTEPPVEQPAASVPEATPTFDRKQKGSRDE